MKLIDILVQELPNRGGWPDGADYCVQHSHDLGFCWVIFNRGIPGEIEADAYGCWSLRWAFTNDYDFRAENLAIDHSTAIITREQYEAALAAKNDDWIDWPDNRMFAPVHSSTLVDVMYGDGEKAHGVRAGNVVWERSKTPEEHQKVIAYRLHQLQEVTEADDETDINECIGQGVAPVWNGEGLPPVGCECEMQDGSGYWISVDIIANKDGFTFGWSYDYRMVYFSDKENEFRPSRSEADKKRDEAVAVMLSVFSSNAATGTKAALKAIYDAIAVGKVRGVKLED